MRNANFVTIPLEVIFAIFSLALGLYALLNDALRSAFSLIETFVFNFLESLLPGFGIYGPWFVIFLGLLLVGMAVWRLSSNPRYAVLSLVDAIAWLAFVPAILYFSNISWIELAGLVSNNPALAILLNLLSFKSPYSIFATSLPVWQIIGIGTAIMSLGIFIPFASGARILRNELIARGASNDESQRITLKIFLVSLGVLGPAVAVVFVIAGLGSLLASALTGSAGALPYPYFALGFVGVIAIAIAVLAYLRSSSRK